MEIYYSIKISRNKTLLPPSRLSEIGIFFIEQKRRGEERVSEGMK